MAVITESNESFHCIDESGGKRGNLKIPTQYQIKTEIECNFEMKQGVWCVC